MKNTYFIIIVAITLIEKTVSHPVSKLTAEFNNQDNVSPETGYLNTEDELTDGKEYVDANSNLQADVADGNTVDNSNHESPIPERNMNQESLINTVPNSTERTNISDYANETISPESAKENTKKSEKNNEKFDTQESSRNTITGDEKEKASSTLPESTTSKSPTKGEGPTEKDPHELSNDGKEKKELSSDIMITKTENESEKSKAEGDNDLFVNNSIPEDEEYLEEATGKFDDNDNRKNDKLNNEPTAEEAKQSEELKSIDDNNKSITSTVPKSEGFMEEGLKNPNLNDDEKNDKLGQESSKKASEGFDESKPLDSPEQIAKVVTESEKPNSTHNDDLFTNSSASKNEKSVEESPKKLNDNSDKKNDKLGEKSIVEASKDPEKSKPAEAQEQPEKPNAFANNDSSMNNSESKNEEFMEKNTDKSEVNNDKNDKPIKEKAESPEKLKEVDDDSSLNNSIVKNEEFMEEDPIKRDDNDDEENDEENDELTEELIEEDAEESEESQALRDDISSLGKSTAKKEFMEDGIEKLENNNDENPDDLVDELIAEDVEGFEEPEALDNDVSSSKKSIAKSEEFMEEGLMKGDENDDEENDEMKNVEISEPVADKKSLKNELSESVSQDDYTASAEINPIPDKVEIPENIDGMQNKKIDVTSTSMPDQNGRPQKEFNSEGKKSKDENDKNAVSSGLGGSNQKRRRRKRKQPLKKFKTQPSSSNLIDDNESLLLDLDDEEFDSSAFRQKRINVKRKQNSKEIGKSGSNHAKKNKKFRNGLSNDFLFSNSESLLNSDSTTNHMPGKRFHSFIRKRIDNDVPKGRNYRIERFKSDIEKIRKRRENSNAN